MGGELIDTLMKRMKQIETDFICPNQFQSVKSVFLSYALIKVE